jgi:amino acid adenylation domain-containing protein
MNDTGIVVPSVAAPMAVEAAEPLPYDLVRAQARANGDRAALADLAGGSRPPLSYAGLVERVDRLADRLGACGLRPAEPVVVLLGRSADTVVAMLAIFSAGGAYCPLDTTAPDARLTAMVRRLGARLALADDAHADRLPAGVSIVDPSDGPSDAPSGSSSDGPSIDGHPAGAAAPPDPDAVAYVLYTSGSTGEPKGVSMTHRGLARLIRWQIGSGRPGLRTLQFAATSFDVTFQEVLSTLATGGCLVVASEEVRRNPDALLDTIVAQRIQRLFLPYVALQLLAVATGRRGVVPESLEHVVTAGERLIVTPAIRAMFVAVPRCRLDNHYGPTETHLVTSLTLPPDRTIWPALPAIGTPVDGVTVHVLDDRLRPVADGDIGELYVAGTALARGYQQDPARTAERFVADPAVPGGRLYRTGDLVRAGDDGAYEFISREDGQLKVRGFRVEPAEVEDALLRHPRVAAAAVGLREVTDGVSVLVAYLQSDAPLPHREVAEHVRGLLPAYMVPARFVHVAKLPRTGSGKIDARALADLDLRAGPADPAATAGEPAAARSLDQTVTEIWARVLGHDEFEPDDDFFDVGGDSLLATWVVAELGQAVGRPVDLSLLLEDSTVEGLTAALAGGPSAAPEQPRSSLIVTLRAGPSGRSLYLVHPLGGELLGYRELARASTAPARLLGIGWSGAPPAFGTSLADLARVHLAQLRTIEPDGPYWLAGWSFGGVLAFEMAHQLTAAGARVGFLGLFDANPVIDPITGLAMAQTPFLRLLDDVVARLDNPATTDADLHELTSSQTWVQLMGAPIAAGASSTYLRTVLDTARACMKAAMDYEPRPYPGPVHLFQAADAGAQRQDRLAAALGELCTGNLTVVPVRGDHWGFIRAEHAAEAAMELDAELERVGAAGSPNHGS